VVLNYSETPDDASGMKSESHQEFHVVIAKEAVRRLIEYGRRMILNTTIIANT